MVIAGFRMLQGTSQQPSGVRLPRKRWDEACRGELQHTQKCYTPIGPRVHPTRELHPAPWGPCPTRYLNPGFQPCNKPTHRHT